MWYVYVLQSGVDGSFYKGSTNDLHRRLKEHNNGEEKYTARLRPWKLRWYTTKANNGEAKRLERKLKNITGRDKLEKFFRKYGGPDAPVGGLDADLH